MALSFLLMSSIPVNAFSTVCLFICPSKDVWDVSHFWNYEQNLYKHLGIGFCMTISFISLGMWFSTRDYFVPPPQRDISQYLSIF